MRRPLSMFAALAAAAIIIPTAAGARPAQAVAVPPSFGTRLVQVPVSEAHDQRALEYIIDDLTPGTVISRQILIANNEHQVSHFTVYPGAARIQNGSFTGEAGQTPNELTTWISVQHGKVTVGPEQSVKDLVTIRVPRIATRGEHYGVIWVQQVSVARTSSGMAVKEVNRVGIRIYLAIGQGGALPTKFAIGAIAGHRSPSGKAVLTASVRNTGGRAVDLSGTARLTNGPGGTSAGPFKSQKVVTIAPGQSGTMTFVGGKQLPSGPWQATVTMISGITKVSASATIDFSGHVPAQTAFFRSSAMVLGGGALAVALVGGIGLVILRRGSPRRRVNVDAD